jgi:UDPglucose--hexose-1-phosphate uridylyltransferase
MSPFEVWILPKQHVNHLANCTDEMLRLIGDAIRFVVQRYNVVLGSPSYNYMFYGIFGDDSYHLNVRLQPVLSTPAGFEKNTGIYINTVTPEAAASYLGV